jgi:Holliday junction DNA helicase RuvA
MISYIQGKIVPRTETDVIVWANGIGYDVMVPATVMKALEKRTTEELENAVLATFHYYENNQSRIIPRLIGFTNDIEREFFELFITVANLGPKTAVKALSRSFHSIAEAIENGSYKDLSSLPGIGEKKARQIVATLQGKAGKFALIQDEDFATAPVTREDIETDAIEVLLQLGYKRSEALDMVKRAIEASTPKPKTTEELIQQIYDLKLVAGR